MSEASARPPAVLLVEDEPAILMILRRVLRDVVGSHDIILVEGGAEALEQLALRPVPVLITDYRMPGIDGMQLTRAIKAAWPATRIIMITADLGADVEALAYAAGVDFFLVKPFPVEDLRQIVRAALGEP
jgi:two-component system, response regulator, stage 0 sporulation protein F